MPSSSLGSVGVGNTATGAIREQCRILLLNLPRLLQAGEIFGYKLRNMSLPFIDFLHNKILRAFFKDVILRTG